MCRKIMQKEYKGFYSLDAALAMLVAAFAYACLSLVISSAAAGTSAMSYDASSRLLSLRISSFILEEGAITGGFGAGQYSKTGELDLGRLSGALLDDVLLRTGRRFASVSVFSMQGEKFSSHAGEAQGEVFCTSRLALLSGKVSRLEVCVS